MIDNPIALVVKEPMFSMDERSLIENTIALVVNAIAFSMDEYSLIENPITLVMNAISFSMDEVALIEKAIALNTFETEEGDRIFWSSEQRSHFATERAIAFFGVVIQF